MSEIFISYARSTAAKAQQIVDLLRALGYGVWRDDDLPAHRSYTDVIEERLKSAGAVLVLWSADAVKSQWVRAEANVAREAGTLVQLTLDGALPPLPFDQIHCANLAGWTGNRETPAWRKVVASLADLAGRDASAMIGAVAAGPPRPDRPSIAVLPFADMSPAQDQGYFCDGMVVEIAAALSRFPTLLVVASGSSLLYRDKGRALGDIADELGVRYLLEGSVRRSADKVRIAVELVDAASRAQVWSARFDGTLDDVFRLQDEVAGAVAGQIAPAVEVAEARRGSARPTTDLTAYDLYLRARHLTQGPVEEKWTQAIDYLDQAIARDPKYALGLAFASFLHALFAIYRWGPDPERARRTAVEYGRKALQLTGDDPEVLHFAGYALGLVGRDFATADAMIERALALNPGASDTWLHSGWIKTYGGRPELALKHFDTSMRLDPRSGWRPLALSGQGWCLLFLGRFDDAIPLLREAVELYPQTGALIGLAAALAHAGRVEEAKTAIAGVSTDAVASFLELVRRPSDRDVMAAGLALAGRV